MRSRARELGRLCWPALRPVARCIADGMAGLAMAYGGVPPAAIWAGGGEPGQADEAQHHCAGEAGHSGAGLATALTRRERKQWAKLTRQLQ